MKKKIILISILVVSVVTISFIGYLLYSQKILIRLPVLVQKDPKFTFIVGNVYYKNPDTEVWKIAIVGNELKKDFEVKTEKDSLADIRFHNGMAIRVAENSILKIDHLTIQKLLLNVNSGSIYGKFEKLFKDYSIEVKTPTTIAAIRGTELGFEIGKKYEEKKKVKKGKKNKKVKDEESDKGTPLTTVYSLSGITELFNPKYVEEKVLLSYQNKISMIENKLPENPEKMTDDEINKIRSILNSIHYQEVLLISDKINFTLGSAEILPSSYAELDKISQILLEKKVKIRIEGHTDNLSGTALNQTLSVKRADSIKNYFVKKGIDPKTLEIAGYGMSKPIADNKTEKGRAQNRRVEFIIIE